jgi:hypothetical protein
MSSIGEGIQFHPLAKREGVVIVADDGNRTSTVVSNSIARDVGRCDLVTADGAMDSESDNTNVETNSEELLLAQTRLAYNTLKRGGTFVLKVFGARQLCTLRVVAFLAACHEAVEIVKPTASKPANDELYIVCRGFQDGVSHYHKKLNLFDPPPWWIARFVDDALMYSHTQLNTLVRITDALQHVGLVEKKRRKHNAPIANPR